MANWLIRMVVSGISIGGIAALSAGCKKDAAMAAASFPPANVTVAIATAMNVPLYVDEIGKATAAESVTLMPQVAGRIDALHFTDGADLKKGQILFTIDARPFQATQNQAEAQLLKDQAALENAQRYLTRQQEIYKQGYVAPSDYDTAVFNAKAANAAVEADKAAIQSAKLNVEYCTMVSPIDGRAGMRLVDPGNVVKINETALLVIQRLDPIYADFTVTEAQLIKVREEMSKGTLKALVKLPEDKDYREGSLTFLDNSVQDGSGTIKLRATLKNQDQHFWPGQFVNVRLVLTELKGAVLVPTTVPQLSQQGTYVLVVAEGKDPTGKPASIAEMRLVKLGQRHNDMIVIESGVKAGEKVITEGQMMVQPGGAVMENQGAAKPEENHHAMEKAEESGK